MDGTDLIARVAASTGLSPSEAARVVADVVTYYAEPVDVFVRRRHSELRRRGLKNPDIFVLIGEELSGRVVAAPELSHRQLRRIVYG